MTADVALGNSTVKHLVEMIGIGVHEYRTSCSARRKIGNGWLALHVFEGVHPDAEMGQKSFGEHLAQFIIDRRSAGRNSITATVTSQGSEKSTVRRASVNAMQAVDNMQSLFKRLKSFDRLGQNCFGQ